MLGCQQFRFIQREQEWDQKVLKERIHVLHSREQEMLEKRILQSVGQDFPPWKDRVDHVQTPEEE